TQSCPPASRLCGVILDAAVNHGIQFAAGRAAVKPACRFRQARGLRRRSEYGSSVQSTNPVRHLKTWRGYPSSLLLQAAGSVSELKLLGNQRDNRPALSAGAPYWFPSPPTSSVPFPPLREERE